MLPKAKMISVAAVALLAIAGGVYAVGSGQTQATPSASKQPNGVVAVAEPNKEVHSPDPGKVVGDKEAVPVATVEPTAPNPPTPIKLTKEQLMPPAPKTEDEKLQKAAEQEYNRF